MRFLYALVITLSLIFVTLEATVPVQGQLVFNQTHTTGIISGFADSYPDNSKAVIQVEDKDMITNPSETEQLQVHIWSYTDANGIWIILSETKPGSGIFQGPIYFSTSSPSGGDTLQVSFGDKVTAEYIDPVSNLGTPEHIDLFTHILGISPPSSPVDLSAVRSNVGITLTWSSPSSDGRDTITGYMIERDDGSGYQTIVPNTNSATTKYIDTGVVAGLIYTYRVSAINSVGTSIPSNEVSVPIPPEGDFEVSVNPETAEMKSGGSTTYSINITTLFGTPQPVSLSCSFQTPSIQCKINPSTLTPNNSATLTVTSDKNIQAGNYTGSITASSNGLIHSIEFIAMIGQPILPPVAKITPPDSIQENTSVQFSADNSYSASGAITSYVWDFGDGQRGEGAIVTHTYQSSGPFTVRLTVTDSNGMQSIDTVHVTAKGGGDTGGWIAPAVGGTLAAAAGGVGYGIKVWKGKPPKLDTPENPQVTNLYPYPRLEVEGGIDE